MSHQVHFTRGVAWMAVGNWSEQVVNLAVFFILLRLIEAEGFGILTMAMAIVLVGEDLVRESVSEYLFSAKKQPEGTVDGLFWILVCIGGALSLLLVLAAPMIAQIYGNHMVRNVLFLCAPIILLTAATSVPVVLLRQRMHMRPLAERAFWGVVLGGAVGIGLALSGFGVWALAAQRLVLTLTNVVMAWRAARWRPGPWPGWDVMRPAIPFMRSMLALRLTNMGGVQLPSIAIGIVLGPLQLGYYAIAWRLIELGSFLIVTPVRTAALPAFAAGLRQRGLRDPLLVDSLRLTGFIAIPAFAGLAAVAPEVLLLFGGPAWSKADVALIGLAPLGMLLCLSKIEESYALAHGRSRALQFIALTCLIATAALMVPLSHYGLAGMAASVSLSAILVSPLRIRLVARDSGFAMWVFFRQQIGPVVASIAMVATVLVLRPYLAGLPALVSLAILSGAGAAVYTLIALWRMKRRLAMARSYLANLGRGAAEIVSETSIRQGDR